MIPNGNIPSPSQSLVPHSKKILPGKAEKSTNVMALKNKNWLIYFHYTRREFGICNIIIKEELSKTNGMNEFANYIQGIILREEGKIQESLEYFQKAHALNPKSVENIKQVARSLSLLGRQKLSIDALQEAQNCSKNQDWNILYNLGLCHYSLGDFEKAKECLRQSVQLNRQECSYSALAKIYVSENDISTAIELYSAALEISPENVDVAISIGLLYMKIGENQKAFEQFGSALARCPDCPKALLATGLMIQEHKEYDVALSKYKSAVRITPESAPLWNNIGMCFFGKRKLVAAITCLKRANFLAPLEWKILYNLGLVHIYSQQYASAFHFFSSTMNLQPKMGRVLLLLAITLSNLNDMKNAQKAFEQAVSHFPEDPYVLLNYSLFLHKQNRLSEAVEAYKKFQLVAQRVRGLDNNIIKTASNLWQKLNINQRITDSKPESSATEKAVMDSAIVTHTKEPQTLEVNSSKSETVQD